MIEHIVLFDLTNKEDSDQVKSELVKLKSLDYPAKLEVQNGYLKNKRRGDLVLVSHFETESKLRAYMNDPIHIDVIKQTSPFIKDKQVIDFYL